MSMVSSSELRRRRPLPKMQPFMKEFPTNQLQLLDQSPTATPFQTRSGSPTRGKIMPHTVAETTATISKLHALMGTVESTERVVIVGPNAIVELSDSAKLHEKLEMDAVSVLDGSAAISAATKVQFLMIYFVFNLGLTLFNKVIMIAFPFPFLLTALHAMAGCIGTGVLSMMGTFRPKALTRKDSATLCAFSLLYTVNIAASNLSLSMVTIPFHQVLRATTPAFTVAIYRICFSRNYSFDTYVSLVPVILGVGLATYGDYYATTMGFFMTLLGATLAAVKTVVTNRMQTAGLHFSAIELLYHLSPLAILQSICMAYYTGELGAIDKFLFEPGNLSAKPLIILLINALMAFGLNVASFTANKKAGALTITVAANVKQILTVLLGVIFWHLKVGSINAFGVAMALVGGAWYARVELLGRRNRNFSPAASIEEGKIMHD